MHLTKKIEAILQLLAETMNPDYSILETQIQGCKTCPTTRNESIK